LPGLRTVHSQLLCVQGACANSELILRYLAALTPTQAEGANSQEYVTIEHARAYCHYAPNRLSGSGRYHQFGRASAPTEP
jgi:hypothetical protein